MYLKQKNIKKIKLNFFLIKFIIEKKKSEILLK